jgi:hypothetical protein
MPRPEEQNSQRAEENRTTIEALRESFSAMSRRLTQDVQPATVYLLYTPGSKPGSPEDME